MTLRHGTVLTMGGGGFSMPEVADAGSLDEHLLGLARADPGALHLTTSARR